MKDLLTEYINLYQAGVSSEDLDVIAAEIQEELRNNNTDLLLKCTDIIFDIEYDNSLGVREALLEIIIASESKHFQDAFLAVVKAILTKRETFGLIWTAIAVSSSLNKKGREKVYPIVQEIIKDAESLVSAGKAFLQVHDS